MLIQKIIVGPLDTNCYLLADESTGEAAIIDPGDEAGKIIKRVEEAGLRPKFILLTHRHPDHVGALVEIKDHFKIDVLGPKEGEKIKLGELEIQTMETPGHTPDGVCFIIGENVISGDTLFKDGIGRTDFPGGDFIRMKDSLSRLFEFPAHFKVFPGHGPETTIGEEMV